MRYMEMLRDPPVALLARRGANFTLEKDIPYRAPTKGRTDPRATLVSILLFHILPL